ncbi:MAG TPA: hypothetical protein VFF13_03465 [archaeon]|nr:hypothetical protein [archaeon]
MSLNDYVAKSNAKKPIMAKEKSCRVCGKSIHVDDTPRHLFFSTFCSEKCKEKYIDPYA